MRSKGSLLLAMCLTAGCGSTPGPRGAAAAGVPEVCTGRPSGQVYLRLRDSAVLDRPPRRGLYVSGIVEEGFFAPRGVICGDGPPGRPVASGQPGWLELRT